MKKITKVIGLMCMAALFAVSASSCKKTEESAEFGARLPQIQGLSMDRAYIDIFDDCQMKWNTGDQIMVYNLKFDDYTQSVARVFTAVGNVDGQLTARFKGRSVGTKKDGLFYFYPAQKASGVLEEGNRETFTVEANQTYNETYLMDPTSLVMACNPDQISSDIDMQHIFGYLHLALVKETAAYVKSVTVIDPNCNLTGNVSLKLHNVNPGLLSQAWQALYDNNQATYEEFLADYIFNQGPTGMGYMPNGNGHELTLNCQAANNGQGVAVGPEAEAQHFFLTVRPGALHGAFTIRVDFMDNTFATFPVTPDADHNYTVRPGWFSNITAEIP